jgi:hypothetical protein
MSLNPAFVLCGSLPTKEDPYLITFRLLRYVTASHAVLVHDVLQRGFPYAACDCRGGGDVDAWDEGEMESF